jgi:4-hydroxy-tetrahydrodipicolinate reductase
MKVSIVGLGKMGQLVLQASKQMKIAVTSSIDPYNKQADFSEISSESLRDADVCICFTNPESALDNIQKIAELKKKIVMATTGWEQHFADAKTIVEKNNVAMIYASNFSIGVNIFFSLIQKAARVIDKFDSYDIFGLELHHNRKLDAPSGTAKTITKLLLENIDRKKKSCYEKLDRKINAEELHFASVRGGDIAGTHSVIFDSVFDNIELKHTAKNRMGFAQGSLVAAKWVLQQKSGLYSEKDLMKYLLQNI